MLFGLFTLFTAICISGVAAWYSIVGLMAIFASAKLAIAIMGAVLEVGKLVTACWVYQNWRTCPKLLKTYLTSAVVVLMLITSMGIFGFLSKAHIDQTLVSGDNSLEIRTYEQRVDNEERRITDAQLVIGQLDETVQVLIDYDRIRGPSGAIATREKQKAERTELDVIINDATSQITELRVSLTELDRQQLKFEADVGPIKYIAEFVYGQKADRDLLDKAVRWVIITIIFVFDPLAVLLLIAANITLRKPKKLRKVVNVQQMEEDWEDIDVEEDIEEEPEEEPKEDEDDYDKEAREWIGGQGETAPMDDSVEQKNRRRHIEVFGGAATYTGKTFWPKDKNET